MKGDSHRFECDMHGKTTAAYMLREKRVLRCGCLVEPDPRTPGEWRRVESMKPVEEDPPPMSTDEKFASFADELDKLVNRYIDEWDVPGYVITGALQFKAAFIMHRQFTIYDKNKEQ